MNLPDPNKIFPINDIDITYIKPTVKNPNIIVGDFTYFADTDFEKNVTHFYDFCGDKLIIGKFCQIAKGVEFVMNGANHKMNCVTTYPFFIFDDWQQTKPDISEMPLKGDIIIGNDVWLGQNVTILAGVNIGDGVIIGLNSVVASDIPPYTVAVGNPARVVKKRFDDELTDLLLKFKWWDFDIERIKNLIPLLTCKNLEKVKIEIKKMMH